MTQYTATTAWSLSNSYPATEDIDVLIGNPGKSDLFWVKTRSDELPTEFVGGANPLPPGERQPIQLVTGDRIWFAGWPFSAKAKIQV
jgi:hypothetical protein